MPQKTYWHLLEQRRVPTEYEVVSTKLHYYAHKGFEVELPWQEWYAKYQVGSPLACTNWEQFADPRQTTYATYTGIQATKELFVDGLLESVETIDYDRRLSKDWVHVLERVLPPALYPFHGLQMIAAYIGQMGPSGRITLTALFQVADEIRRIQRLAYRQRQLNDVWPGFGTHAKLAWQTDPAWQPLRGCVEQLLVTYDWGEAFVGLNLVLKPLVDEVLMRHLGERARAAGDYLLQQVLLSLDEDGQWQRQWSQALVALAVQDTPANRPIIHGWLDKWHPRAHEAVNAVAALFEPLPPHGRLADLPRQLDQALRAHLGR